VADPPSGYNRAMEKVPDRANGEQLRSRRQFRWAVEADVPPPGLEGRKQLEAEGWQCVGTHPLYTRSHLMERSLNAPPPVTAHGDHSKPSSRASAR
jgi:hypothetical protein